MRLTREDSLKIKFALILDPSVRMDFFVAVLMPINMIVAFPAEETRLPPVDVIRNGMLDPFRNHLTDYEEDI